MSAEDEDELVLSSPSEYGFAPALPLPIVALIDKHMTVGHPTFKVRHVDTPVVHPSHVTRHTSHVTRHT